MAMTMYLCFETQVLRFFALIGFLAGAITVYGQNCFVSIDCGTPAVTNYTDSSTMIVYSPDSLYIDTGKNYNISKNYILDYWPLKQLEDIRSFPDGNLNCYTINGIHQGGRYLMRSFFLYGNYDGQLSASSSTPLQFNLYIGVNLWKLVNITDPHFLQFYEIITMATADYFSICLENIGKGTPFISSLELRFIDDPNAYADVTPTISLEGISRANMGANTSDIMKYPTDTYDRTWIPWNNESWSRTSANNLIENPPWDTFHVPSMVMNTAVIPTSNTTLAFHWDAIRADNRPVYYMYLHFARFDDLPRSFDVFLNNELKTSNFTPDYRMTSHVNLTFDLGTALTFHLEINRAASSTLPPILNALEIFRAVHLNFLATDRGDVDGMLNLKEVYDMKIWQGDPCNILEKFSWKGVACSVSDSNPPRVTTLNLSSHGLTGVIPKALEKLKAIKYLDLSNNKLSGSIPSFLADLPSLVMLNLSGNQLSGLIPDALLGKQASGLLDLQVGNNQDLCWPGNNCTVSRKIPIIIIAIVISAVFAIIIILLLVSLYRRRSRRRQNLQPTEGEVKLDKHLRIEQFTYPEVKRITKNFGRVLGKGGFGIVYYGSLKDGLEVAVKMCSRNTSTQGTSSTDPTTEESDYNAEGNKEFWAEALLLSRVHHKNLVSLVGCCKACSHLALIYEYMSQGSLRDHLMDKAGEGKFLSWSKRIEIAVDAAQGLEYLHRECTPLIVHRDVKTSNILLSSNLEAKLADFGLSKAFHTDIDTHVSTNVIAGTPGYLDPEYHNTFQLTEKSDVYSFGIVLLELITGLPAVVKLQETCHILQWVHNKLSRGDVTEAVDARLHGQYEINSVRKVVDIAIRCTMPAGRQRPSMSEVVVELKESLDLLEISRKSSLHAFGATPDASLQGESLEIMCREMSAASVGRPR